MKSFFKTLRKCWDIIKINTVNTWQEETAHFWNNWGSIVSTTTYTIVSIIFVHILINKFKLIAGYNLNQLLFFNLLGQLAYFSANGFFKPSIDHLITSIKRGNLDFTLLKPVPSLFYISFRKIPLVSIFRDSIANILVYVFIIDWKSLNLQPNIFLIALIMIILGIIIWHCFMFMLTFTIFWLGESKRVFLLNQSIADDRGTPYEGFPKNIRLFLTFIIPMTLNYSLPVSIALEKSNPSWIFLSIILAIIFIFLKKWVWIKGLKAYTSAS